MAKVRFTSLSQPNRAGDLWLIDASSAGDVEPGSLDLGLSARAYSSDGPVSPGISACRASDTGSPSRRNRSWKSRSENVCPLASR